MLEGYTTSSRHLDLGSRMTVSPSPADCTARPLDAQGLRLAACSRPRPPVFEATNPTTYGTRSSSRCLVGGRYKAKVVAEAGDGRISGAIGSGPRVFGRTVVDWLLHDLSGAADRQRSTR